MVRLSGLDIALHKSRMILFAQKSFLVLHPHNLCVFSRYISLNISTKICFLYEIRQKAGWMVRIRIIHFQKKFHDILPDIVMFIKVS